MRYVYTSILTKGAANRFRSRKIFSLSASSGEVLERLNRPVSKTGVGVTPPWVRIPPSPPSFKSLRFNRRRLDAERPRAENGVQKSRVGRASVASSPAR